MNAKKIILTLVVLLSCSMISYGQTAAEELETGYRYRMGADFQIKIFKGLKLDLEPELRFGDEFELDKLVLSTALSYKAFGCVTFGAAYKFIAEYKTKKGENYTEWCGRYNFDVEYGDDFGRFSPSVRVRYDNYADDDIDDKEYLRYRVKLEYDIDDCKLTPAIAVEAFQELDDMMLYKMRYSAEVDYKFTKTFSMGLNYKFDFFNLEYKNNHIFSLGAKFKF